MFITTFDTKRLYKYACTVLKILNFWNTRKFILREMQICDQMRKFILHEMGCNRELAKVNP